MTRDDQIDDLLDRWESARDDGRDIAAEELCRDFPDLLPTVREHIDALKWIPLPGNISDQSTDGATEPGQLLPGMVLEERYVLGRRVGAGGFATVWQAHDRRLHRDVALKIPRRSQAGSTASRAFIAEARRLAQLRHPNIVPVYDVVSGADGVFIVSALIEGQTLADELAAGSVDSARAVHLAVQIAECLQHAHQQGFVHRDIKPANILIDNHGEPHLTDFGIAVSLDTQVATPGLSGTLSYMAPEQAHGDGKLVDARTDVFSLGVVLYELLAGRRPFEGRNPTAIRKAILEAEPLELRSRNNAVSQTLNDVCLQALAKAPEDRFDTAADFAAALRDCEAAGQGRWSLATAAVMGLVALGLIGGSSWLVTHPDAVPRQGAAVPDLRPGPPLASAPVPSPAVPMASAIPATVIVEADLVLRGHRGKVSSVAVSADGQWLVSGGWDKSVRVWVADTGTIMGIYRGHTTGVAAVALSSDGRFVASGGGHNYKDSTIRVWDTEAGKRILQFDDHRHNVMAVAWAPNGEFLVSGSLDNTVRRWVPQVDHQMQSLGPHKRPDINNWPHQVWAVAISPDSRTVAAGLRDGSIRLIDADTGRQRAAITTSTPSWINSIAFSPDGTQILSGSRDGVARRFDVGHGELLTEYEPGLGTLNAVAWTSDGAGILCGGDASTFVMLDAVRTTKRATFQGHTEAIHCLTVTPDGRVVSGSNDATVRVWKIHQMFGQPAGD